MKRIVFIILTFIILVSCNQSRTQETINQSGKKKTETYKCPDFEFKTPQEQADSMLAFMYQAQSSNINEKNNLERLFFCGFPNSFREMQEIFGYDNQNGAAPLYEYPNGNNVIQFFSSLTSIPDKVYYEKYINININGVWEADNIREAFNFHKKLLDDTENVCSVLSTFNDSEIKSVFHFIFDGPHPDNEHNEKIYIELKSKIGNQNQHLSKLLTESYEQLMTEDDGHGH